MQQHSPANDNQPTTHNLTGLHFGRVRVLGPDAPDATGRRRWRCRCACGAEASAYSTQLHQLHVGWLPCAGQTHPRRRAATRRAA